MRPPRHLSPDAFPAGRPGFRGRGVQLAKPPAQDLYSSCRSNLPTKASRAKRSPPQHRGRQDWSPGYGGSEAVHKGPATRNPRAARRKQGALMVVLVESSIDLRDTAGLCLLQPNPLARYAGYTMWLPMKDDEPPELLDTGLSVVWSFSVRNLPYHAVQVSSAGLVLLCLSAPRYCRRKRPLRRPRPPVQHVRIAVCLSVPFLSVALPLSLSLSRLRLSASLSLPPPFRLPIIATQHAAACCNIRHHAAQQTLTRRVTSTRHARGISGSDTMSFCYLGRAQHRRLKDRI